jgi:hypothetical protein
VSLDHIGELPEVVEWEDNWHGENLHLSGDQEWARDEADAALAAADREVGRLRWMLRLAIEDGLPNFKKDDEEDRSLMASRLADLRARAEEWSGT